MDKVDFSWDIVRTRRRFEPGDKLLGPAYRDGKFRAYEWFGCDWLGARRFDRVGGTITAT